MRIEHAFFFSALKVECIIIESKHQRLLLLFICFAGTMSLLLFGYEIKPLMCSEQRNMKRCFRDIHRLFCFQLVEKSGTQTQFVDATNRFYTLIPHDFGMGKIKILDTAESIKQKTEMLDNLLEIEVAYSLLRGGDEGADPIDGHYKKLKCKLDVSYSSFVGYLRQ